MSSVSDQASRATAGDPSRPASSPNSPAGVIKGAGRDLLVGARLTAREQEVIRLYGLGWTLGGIADKWGCSPRTVAQHAYHARRKGAVVPRIAKGTPARTVDYGRYARDARDGMTATAIAAKHGVSVSTVARALRMLREDGADVPVMKVGGNRSQRPDWTPERLREAQDLAARIGKRPAAAELGISYRRLWVILRRAAEKQRQEAQQRADDEAKRRKAGGVPAGFFGAGLSGYRI